jgi:hypothetical protein
MNERSHRPPGSKLLGLFVVPQKERHTREETEKLKSSEVVKQGRQKEKEERKKIKGPADTSKAFSLQNQGKKGQNRQICIFGFHFVAEYRDI